MLLICVLFAGSLAELFSAIVYSEHTPSQLVAEFSEFVALHSPYSISLTQMTEELSDALDPSHLNLVFDFTFSVQYEHKLKSYCSFHRLIYFSNNLKTIGKWIFGLHPSSLDRGQAIQKLLDELNWKEYHLISSETEDSLAIYQLLSADPVLVISSEVDQEVYDLHIGREIKPTGNWKLVALTNTKGSRKVLQALNNLLMYKERCGLIISTSEPWGEFELGTIVLSEEGLESSKSAEEYKLNSIIRAIQIANLHFNNGSIINNEMLRQSLEENTKDHIISSTFSIVNFTPDLTVIGNITDRVYLSGVVFPGNVSEFNTSPPRVHISGNLALINPDGSISGSNYLITLAIAPMIKIINSDPDLLPNFVLEVYSTDCGADLFDYAYVSQCMKRHINNLGGFYMDVAFEEVGKGTIQVFRENNITIPHTGVFYHDWSLYDKELYPELFITNAHWMYLYAILPYILNTFRWDEILVFFSHNVASDLYDAFTKNAEILGISILNQLRFVPYYYPNQSFYQANEETLKEAVKLKCRIYVLMLDLPHSLLFVESLYDLGLRKGEAVVIMKEHLSYTINEPYGHNKTKVIELADGSLSLYINEYIGEYGENLQKEIAAAVYPAPTYFSCFQVDSLLLGVHTIDLMLRIGRNYEDPADLNYFIRQIKFTGCSGPVSIDSGGNGRNELAFTLRNFYRTETEEIDKVVGNYTIGVMVPLQISKGIVWPGGSLSVPEDMIIEPECGIKESDIQENQASISLIAYGSIGYFLTVVSISFIVWFKYYRFKFKRIKRKREIMFEDGVEIATPILEGFQYVVIGPGVSILHYLAMFLQVDSFFEMKYTDFWRGFFGITGLAFVWSLCVTFVIFLLDQRCFKKIKNFMRYIGLTLLPLFSKMSFIFIMWVFLRLFECKKGTGEEATDAFLKNDCHVRCWEGFHLGVVCCICVVLPIYTLLYIISSTLYDKVMDHVSIKANTFFVLMKSLLNVALVLLHFNLKDYDSLVFCIVFFGLLLLWTAFTFRTESYNCASVILWQNLTLVGVCCHFLLILIQEITQYNSVLTISVDLTIMLAVVVYGLVIQFKYLPGYFYLRKGRNFDKLLKFAFTRRIDPKELTEHQLDYKKRDKEQSS